MSYPDERPRRLRRSERLRAMVRETTLTPASLIYPLFVTAGQRRAAAEIPSLPGCYHLSVDQVVREAEVVEKLGIGGVILFGLPSAKDPVGSEGYADDGVVQQAIARDPRRLQGAARRHRRLLVRVHLARPLRRRRAGEVQNDPSLELLAKMAVSHARRARTWWRPPT
jgi:porphobilinogen synthase